MTKISVGFNGGLVDSVPCPLISMASPTPKYYQYPVGQLWVVPGPKAEVFIFVGGSRTPEGVAGNWYKLSGEVIAVAEEPQGSSSQEGEGSSSQEGEGSSSQEGEGSSSNE